MKKRQFGSLEMEVLSLFSEDKTLSVHEVQEKLGGKDRYTTIMTVLSRLVDKKKLQRKKEKNKYFYFLKEQKKSIFSSIIKQFVDRVFKGKTTSLVKCLIEEETLDDKELKQIEDMIKKARKKQ